MCDVVRADEWGSFVRKSPLSPLTPYDAHKGARHATPAHYTLARACVLRSSPYPNPSPCPCVHVCVKERLPDMLSVCLQLFLYALNGIASKMRTILYGRQLAVSWCTSRVNFEFRCRFEPLPRLPPACLFALAGVIRSRGG